MPILRVNGKIFNYPDQGKEPNNGKVQADWAKEVSTVVDGAFGSGTILETQAVIENDIQEINKKVVGGLLFNSTLSKSATVQYRIYRKSENSIEKAEQGILYIMYSEAAPLNRWTITREIVNGEPALVYFDVDNNGQVYYWSSDVLINTPDPDSDYEGYIRFSSASNVIK